MPPPPNRRCITLDCDNKTYSVDGDPNVQKFDIRKTGTLYFTVKGAPYGAAIVGTHGGTLWTDQRGIVFERGMECPSKGTPAAPNGLKVKNHEGDEIPITLICLGDDFSCTVVSSNTALAGPRMKVVA